MSVARVVRAGPGAARALRGTGRVEIVLDGGGYVSLGCGRWLLLASPRAQHGPLSLHVASLGPLVAGAPAQVVGAELEIGHQRVQLAGMRVVGPRVPPRAGQPRAPSGGGTATPPRRALPALSVPPPEPQLRAGLEALERGELRAAVELLAGRGEGLTPAGDDLLAGYAGWKAWAGAPVRLADAAASRTTALSAAYLRCAERGELPEAAEALIVALRAGDVCAIERGVARLARWGGTSGQAIMLGIAAGAQAR
jgi:Protein of unknown function (DUF2877)